jgi:protease I
MPEKLLSGKKIAMIIAFQDFRDEELFIPRSIFLAEGAEVKLISSKKGKALGIFGGIIDVDFTFEEFDVKDFDAVIFVGGAGAHQYIEDKRCWEIAQKAVAEGKLLGAICIAPSILARAGILKGKRATVWQSPLDKSAVKILKEGGAKFEKAPVVVDGKIITANGPEAARKFAEAIIKSLNL